MLPREERAMPMRDRCQVNVVWQLSAMVADVAVSAQVRLLGHQPAECDCFVVVQLEHLTQVAQRRTVHP
jgi:hypothetical protein